MRYACLVYHDPTKLAGRSEDDQLAAILTECASAAAWKAELEKGGYHVFSAGLQSISAATTVRINNGKLSVTDGPFAETKEFLGGFTIIEARDLNEALRLVSKFVSTLVTVEVRPLMDANAELTDPLDLKIAKAMRGNALRPFIPGPVP
jgi:hypothetical protein